MKHKKLRRNINPQIRLYAVGAVFLVFCAVFAARLIYYQLIENDRYASAVINGNVRTEKVVAARGEIRDRNGRALVTNEYSRNMILDYYDLPDTRAEVHKVFLAALSAVEATENTDKMGESYFPLEGAYPNYSYTEAAQNTETTDHARLLRFVKNNLCKNGEEAQDAIKQYSAHDIAIYIAEKYEIIKAGKDTGYQSEFSNSEVDKLIRLRYAMELSGFGAASNYTLAEGVDDKLISYVAERHIDGVRFEYESKRCYKYEGYASHILGTVGPIYAEDAEYYSELGYSMDSLVGKSGCEYAFEEYLHGKDGTLAIVEDDDGNVINTYYIEEPIPGNDVYLTIDIEVQIAAEDALAENIETRINAWRGGKADAGAVVATDPKSGAVLAIASYPSFSLSSFNADYDPTQEVSPYLNRALLAYAPGSTFKVGMALAALQEGLIAPDTVMHTEGIYKGLACSHYSESAGNVCCGDVDVEGALMVSCNYFFSKLGDQLTVDRIRSYSTEFGFGEETGIELGESEGKIAQSLPHAAAIGQSENLCTPLQVSQYIAMIANGGKRYSSHLLYAVRTPAGETVKSEVISEINTLDGISEENFMTVRQGMYDVVSGDQASSYVRDSFVRVGNEYMIGGKWTLDERGKEMYVGGVRVAGKTGTAETADSKAGKSSDNAWFTGFAPFEDPQIVVTCFIEKGITGGYSSYAVARTMDAYFAAQSSDSSAEG